MTILIMSACNPKQKTKAEISTRKENYNILYHSYNNSASDFHINKWNIDSINLPARYVIEKVDQKGRVKELKFFKEKSLKYSILCYLNPWVKFDYPSERIIIAYFLNYKGEEDANIECGMPSKITYYLSEDRKTIIDSKSEYNLNKEFYIKNGWDKTELENLLETLNSEKLNSQVVSYFSNSFNKMNGIYPTSKEFNIKDALLSDAEKNEILKSVK